MNRKVIVTCALTGAGDTTGRSEHVPVTPEEIAQDVFLQLFRKRHQIESPSHLLFWLRQVTARRCIDALRQRPWLLVSLDTTGEIPTAEASPDPLLARSLRKSVAALPPMQRLIITLRYQEELEIAEIASVVRLPLNTVKSHLHRALQVLRRQMEVRG